MYCFCFFCCLFIIGIFIRVVVDDKVDIDVGSVEVCIKVGMFVVWFGVGVWDLVGFIDVGRLVWVDVSSFVEFVDVISFVVVEYV